MDGKPKRVHPKGDVMLKKRMPAWFTSDYADHLSDALARTREKVEKARRDNVMSTNLSKILNSKLKGNHANGFDFEGAILSNDDSKFKAFVDETLLQCKNNLNSNPEPSTFFVEKCVE